jgi:hypothetical protein
MAAILLDFAGQPVPPLATFISRKIPIEFLRELRPLLESSCQDAFLEESTDHENDFSYWRNVQPHDRNAFAFERLHALGVRIGMKVTERKLENHYSYPEFESNGLTFHVKHDNNRQSLQEQITKADYRLSMAGRNSGFGQLPLQNFGDPIMAPKEAYFVIFYRDGDRKNTVGSVVFALPSAEGEIVDTCEIEKVIDSYEPPTDGTAPDPNDDIPLPPKNPIVGQVVKGRED